MGRPRAFDHDEARRLVAAGVTQKAVAARFGVSQVSVGRAVSSELRERAARKMKAAFAATCEKCGGPCLSPRHGAKRTSRAICHPCWSTEQRRRLRYTDDRVLVAVYCSSCKRWQPPDQFSRGVKFKDVRDGGIHKACRTCNTRMRQEHRQRHKVPCRACGAPCLPASEKGTHGADTGLCQPCYQAGRRKVAA